MRFKDVLTSPDPEPGEVFDAFREKASQGGIRELAETVGTLEEQKQIANARLGYYLENLSDSRGATTVIEEFYRDKHGKEIDASDPDALKREIPDVDSIIHDDALPVVSKTKTGTKSRTSRPNGFGTTIWNPILSARRVEPQANRGDVS
ncbi:MAG: hypothetical protein SXQ77_13295 [Halobacteria archaeon]|nr:hypothetical protein [Halobacteria archaeon]